MDGSDRQLLEEHRHGSQEAFSELVRRHVDWIHSAARRRMNDEHAAEDVTQCVFEVLARKGPRLKEGEALSPWLHGVLILTCRHGLRTELRRQRRERAAAMMRGEATDMESRQWEELVPHLDELVDRLGRGDRQAILLRFFEQKSLLEIGTLLGISEDAARKRVSRATDRLRDLFAAEGLGLQSAALAGLLLAEAVRPTAAGLAGQIASGSGVASSAMAKGVLTVMAISKTKSIVVGVLVAMLLTAGGYFAATKFYSIPSGNPSRIASSLPPTTAQLQAAEADRLYSLEPGSVLKNVVPPYPAGRNDFIWSEVFGNRDRPRPERLPAESVFLQWANGVAGSSATLSTKITLDDVLRLAIRLQPYDFQGPPELLSEQLPGDWVVRADASHSQRLEALSDLLATSRGWRLHFENRLTEQQVIVVTGRYAFQRLPEAKDEDVHVYDSTLDGTEGIVRSDPIDRFFDTFAREMRIRFVNQVEGNVPDRITWVWHDSSKAALFGPPSADKEMRVRKVFDAIGAQTGLKFTRTLQTWDVWHVERQP